MLGKGIPFSPFLFLMAVEGLNYLIDKATDLGLITGIFLSNSSNPISLLQYRDDAILFIPTDMSVLRNLQWILRCFEQI